MVVGFFLLSTSILAQSKVEGTVVDESGTIPGATVVEKGTSNGTTTDFDGKFSLEVNGTAEIQISFVGYKSQSFVISTNTDLGEIILIVDDNVLEEVFVTGTVHLAKDRETPVAVSTITSIDIQKNLGTQELPEMLNNTPSVYATKQGGGFGDSRINIRGFDQSNTAVMINGQPVNDMENGWVYWSNWAGLADVTSAMQVQRGLGASKLAIASVGGTINVVTKSSSVAEGGTVMAVAGNNGYQKYLANYNTGKLESGFSFSILLSTFKGDGYIDGTKGAGSNYFIGLGYEVSEKHNLQFIFTGAPQWHHQKSFEPSISDHQLYQEGGPDPTATTPNRKYNSDWGYLNGEEYSFRRNFYHKPVMSLNWEYKITDSQLLSVVLYGSWGRGGGTGEMGRINGGRQYQFKDANGLIPVDNFTSWNAGGTVNDPLNSRFDTPRTVYPAYPGFYNDGNDGHPEIDDINGDPIAGGKYGSDNGISRRASMNSHNWYGTIINYHNDVSEHWSFDVGADVRRYKGIHYRVVNDVLGADAYVDYDNINYPAPNNAHIIMPDEFVDATASWNPWDDIESQEKIDYYNDGLVGWQGLFGQGEWKNDAVSVFVQASFSNQGYERIDYFSEPPESQKTGVKNLTGGNIKAGLNWRINDVHNVFFNSGYYSKQPLFDAVYINYGNNLNPDLVNEKIIGLELGYGIRTAKLNLNANLYRTSWADRFESASVTLFEDTEQEFRGTANYEGVTEIHTGIEVDFLWRILDNLRINGMVSIGHWEYKGNSDADIYDDNQNLVGTTTLYLDGVKVGDAAQTTAALGVSYDFFKGFSAGLNWRYAANLYADFNVVDFRDEDNLGAIKLPSFNLVDARISYTWLMKKGNSLGFSLNVNNVFDELYISESDTNYHVRDGDDTWKGIATGNRVFFGWGRTWNFAIRFRW